MGLGLTLANMFGRSELSKVIGEQVEAKLKEANSQVKREREDADWRPISQKGIKAFKPMEQAKMFKICYFLYDKNPLGHRIIERYKDFVVGEGLTYACSDPEVLKVIDAHWNDPDNQWELGQAEKVGELGIYGEQYYPTFVNDSTGHVKLGYVDPEIVEKVTTEKGNVKKKVSYTLYLSSSESEEPKTYKLINQDQDSDSKTYGLLIGESFYFSINNVVNMPRGRADLFPIADSIDTYEHFLFNRAERADILNRIIYDLQLDGKSTKEIQEILKDFHIPRSNEVHGHNEKTKLSIISPKLESQDATSEAKLHFNHIMGGSGYPGHWFASGEGTTRATAVAMDLPTKKQLKSRQKIFKAMVSYIFRYVIHQSIIHQKLTMDKKDVKVKINLPKIEEKDTEVVARTLVAITQSLVVATEEGWITNDTAKKVYATALSQLGEEVEAAEVIEKTQEEIDEKLKRLYERRKNMKKKLPEIPVGEDEE